MHSFSLPAVLSGWESRTRRHRKVAKKKGNEWNTRRNNKDSSRESGVLWMFAGVHTRLMVISVSTRRKIITYSWNPAGSSDSFFPPTILSRRLCKLPLIPRLLSLTQYLASSLVSFLSFFPSCRSANEHCSPRGWCCGEPTTTTYHSVVRTRDLVHVL